MSYVIDRQWGDSFLPAVRQIVGPRLLVPAPFENDTKEATDLMVLRANDFRTAVRIRRPGYARRFPHEFTIRYDKPSGARTEFEKIMDGFGDWMLYGHEQRTVPGQLEHWMLLDLGVFRWVVSSFPNIVPEPIMAPDGVRFLAFDVRAFPEELVIDRTEVSHELAAA